MSDSGRVIGQNNPYHPNYEGNRLMDLSKLTPAPWKAEGCEVHGPRVPSGKGYEYHMTIYDEGGHNEDEAAFIALARNAFDVMMRPPLHQMAILSIVAAVFRSRAMSHNQSKDMAAFLAATEWPDPFTALVEADQWYTKNVEGK